MTLRAELFDEIKPYLIYDRKMSANKHNMQVYRSRFGIMSRYFGEREFNRTNFTAFIGFLREKGYSNNYINNFIKLAKHVDKFYKINEIQDFTYFDKPEKLIDYLSAQEIEKMIAYDYSYRTDSERKNQMFKAIFELLYLTGARINEILDIRWEDVKEGKVPCVLLNATKTNEYRYAAIGSDLYNTIVNLPHFGGFVFSNDQGHRITDESVLEDIKRRARGVGINRRVYNHLIRHSVANLMLRNGASLEMVAKQLGHKHIDTTYRHYVHVLLEELNSSLHAHHPRFKQKQTLDIIRETGKDLLTRLIDTERFFIHAVKHEHQISFHVKEIEEE